MLQQIPSDRLTGLWDKRFIVSDSRKKIPLSPGQSY